jgi:hypothetical protein
VRLKPVAQRKRVRISFDRRGTNPVKVEVFQKSVGRKVVGRRVAVFRNRKAAFTWRARKARNGYYQIRYTTTAPNGSKDVRHLGVRRRKGQFRAIGPCDQRASCELVKYFRLRSPVFGGVDRRPLPVVFRLKDAATVSVVVLRRGKVVQRIAGRRYLANQKHTVVVRLGRKGKRGLYTIKLKAERPGRGSELALYSRYL